MDETDPSTLFWVNEHRALRNLMTKSLR